MFLCCPCSFKNGSLTRERIKDECAEGSWEKFSEYLTKTPTGNNGNIGKCQFCNLNYSGNTSLTAHHVSLKYIL